LNFTVVPEITVCAAVDPNSPPPVLVVLDAPNRLVLAAGVEPNKLLPCVVLPNPGAGVLAPNAEEDALGVEKRPPAGCVEPKIPVAC